MNRYLAIGAIVIAAAALYFGRDAIGIREPAPRQTAEATVPAAPGDAPRVVEGLTPAQMAEAPEFAFRRLEIDTSKPEAEACLVFTRKLDASGRTRYEDYLSFRPETRVAVRAADERLCIGGLAFNETYSITLKAGLPAASGETAAEAETVEVALKDRPALVRFGGGVLLPRENADGVPVTTINIDRLKLKVIRVGDRLLAQLQTGLIDQTELYGWDKNQLEREQGSLVWEGEMAVTGARNEAATTLIPIRELIGTGAPGAYLILGHDAAEKDEEREYWSSTAAQWVIDSDIGLTTFEGAHGLAVFARSFASAAPIAGVELTLVARNNNVLQRAATDANGRADFDPGFFRGTGGDEPVAVMAYGAQNDFTFLDLRRAAFDLTDRGVGGRESPGPIDAYLYTERGVYRPGERVEAVAMLRDRVGDAVTAPLTLVATRPDGIEYRRVSVEPAGLAAGAVHWPLELTATALHGRWQIAAYVDPKAPAVGRVQFDVADFVPQKLKLTLAPETKTLAPGGDVRVRVESRFLYGAAAAGLGGEGEARITRDPAPYPQFADYSFGRVDDRFNDVLVALTLAPTDETGATVAEGNLGALPETTLPLKAVLRIGIHEPGGRATEDTVELPVRTGEVVLGLRPDFRNGAVNENAPAGFEVVALDATGVPIAREGLTYEWVREIPQYQWYQVNGQWQYERIVRDRIAAGGSFAVGAESPAKLSMALPWGTYRLTVSDPASGAAASYRFWSGWAAASEGDRPDRVAVAADKTAYAPGETARIDIRPPSDGKALVVVAGDRVYSSQLIDAPASGAAARVEVSAEWGAGAYVLVTHYRPLDSALARAPVRAIGAVWLGVDNAAQTLAAAIGGPEKIAPRQRVTIPVTLGGLAEGEEAYITLAAVDEGILQLTDFKSPDPNDHYFGKRRLGVGVRDDYGRLIKADRALLGEVRSGGDGFGGRPLAVVPQRTVALFSGPVKADANGKADIAFDVPDFNGELRLMAVAMSADKLGHAERALTVRDAVVGELVLPRFLAPGDHAEAGLNLHNVEGAPGHYTATVSATGGAHVPGIVPETSMGAELGAGERVLLTVPLAGIEPGIATVRLALEGPGGFRAERTWPIEVRPAQLPVTRDEVALIPPGESWTATSQLAAGLMPATVKLGLTVSASRGYNDVAGLLRWLDGYPYGCIEQTTSRAMPLLVFNDLADIAGLPRDETLRARVQDAADRVLDMQNHSGGFGMWGAGGEGSPWISVFALDFLFQAEARGYVVPDEALRRGAGWLRNVAASDWRDDATRAYAFYVLARQGQANLSDLRYFSDVRGPEMSNALAAGLMGGALAQAGDRSRASFAFARAHEIAMRAQPRNYPNADYGTLLRDVAGVTALAAEAGEAQMIPALLTRGETFNMRLNATTTQEKAWMLRAAYELLRERAAVNVEVNGRAAPARAGAVRLAPDLGELESGIALRNAGQAAVWRIVSVEGTPAEPMPAEAHGMVVEKTVWTLDGNPADLANLKQNERVVVLIAGQMENNYYREMAALDLLPAGLEIETTLSGQEGEIYPWLGPLSNTTVAEARDDRYVAAFELGSRYRPSDPNVAEPRPEFRLAYVARAVTPGRYEMPAVLVEDMYAPSVRARTAMGTAIIAAAE